MEVVVVRVMVFNGLCLSPFSSFLDFYPLAGSFQVNPPLCEELIAETLQHIDRLLTDSMEPLRWVVNKQSVQESNN